MVEIKEVKTRSDLKKFLKFPLKLYSGNSYFVPSLYFDEMNTLRRDRNPAFDFCEASYWLAYKNRKVAGRIAGIINPAYNEHWDQKRARFGWVDFIDDEEVSGALFDAVEAWAKEKGMVDIHGPLGFCDLDRQGTLIEGFDEPGMIITIYNHPYYRDHMKKMGYCKDTDWLEYEIKTPDEVPDKLERLNEIVLKRSNLKILEAKKAKDLLPYADRIFEVLDEAYKELYGFAPLTQKQVKVYVKQFFGFVNPDYVKVVLNDKDDVIAFGIAMPSLSDALRKSKGKLFPLGFLYLMRQLRRCERLDLYLIAVRPDFQGKGVNAMVLTEIAKAALKNGVKCAETGPELEDNKKVQALWKFFETRQHKRRRCYIKKI
jgi:GNAT superfamily N-acetyltransferase